MSIQPIAWGPRPKHFFLPGPSTARLGIVRAWAGMTQYIRLCLGRTLRPQAGIARPAFLWQAR